MKCPDNKMIKRYVWEDILDVEVEMAIGEHIDSCEKCMKIAREENQIKEFLENFTAESHGQIYHITKIDYLLRIIAKCIEFSIESQKVSWYKERFIQWREMDKSLWLSTIMHVEIGDKHSVLIPTFKKDSITTDEQGFHQFCSRNKVGLKDESSISIIGKDKFDLTIEAADRIISLDFNANTNYIPLVILLSEKGTLFIGYPEKLSGDRSHCLIFDNLNPGKYLLFFESCTNDKFINDIETQQLKESSGFNKIYLENGYMECINTPWCLDDYIQSLRCLELKTDIECFKTVSNEKKPLYISRKDTKIFPSLKIELKEKYNTITPTEKNEYYTLSSAQKRLFILQQMDDSGTIYNMPSLSILEGDLDSKRLEQAFKKLIKRHESLRTSFEMIVGEPVQRIHENVEFEIENYASSIKNFIRPFDLSQAPLLRVRMVKGDDKKQFLMVDMHHIISDGMSKEIFVEEYMMLYAGAVLPPLRIQYKDYSQWQKNRIRSAEVKAQEAYWLNEMAGEIPVLELPFDYPRQIIRTSEGAPMHFDISQSLTDQLKQLALETGTTSFMVLLGVFNLLLSKLSSQEDIIVGTPTDGRTHNNLKSIIGIFINTLALRNFPSQEKRFSEFLAEVKENCLKAFENQDYRYEDLVEAVVTERYFNRNSLFDVMFVLQDRGRHRVEIPGFTLAPYEYQDHTSKFDITLTVVEESNQFKCLITYSTVLFKENTIKRFVNYFKHVLYNVLGDHNQRLSEIDILPDEEKERLLSVFSTTDIQYLEEKTIHQLFEEQADKTPNNISLVGAEHQLTYQKLNEKANQLAWSLRGKGVGPDTVVGLLVDPSVEMIIGILSVLKAGGAYLAIDTSQPEERIAYMLEDSLAVALLTTGKLTVTIPFDGTSLIFDDTAVYTGDAANLTAVSKPTNMAYIIYTSETTGKFKGSVIENGNLVNYICWLRKKVQLTDNDRTLFISSFGLDLGYTSIYSSLLTGGQLHIISWETCLSPEDLINYIRDHRVTYLRITPKLFSTMVESPSFSVGICRSLRLIVLGGEAIKLKDVEKKHAAGPHIEVMNHYGSTDATIGCVAQLIDFNTFDDYRKSPTISHPIDNMKAVILDKNLKLVPIGVPGELCLSGAGVIRGYLNRPELTAVKFINLSEQAKCDFTFPTSSSSLLYRTGDLVRRLPEGTIEFLGHIDTQVKLRGYRIELGEIESQLLIQGKIKEAAVILKEHPTGDKYLCAYIVWNRTGEEINISELREYLLQTLPGYMIPSYFISMEKIPLTTNGELNRRLLPEPETGPPTTDYVAPRNRLEMKLAELWVEILGLKNERIGIDDNFFQLGGHSLKAVILVYNLQKALDIKVSLAEIFKNPTIRGLSTHINHLKGAEGDRYTAIRQVEKREYYPLSSAQKRLFILHRLDEMETEYNMPMVVKLEGGIIRMRLEDTLKKLIHRHESLRTSFEIIDGEPVQRVHDDVDFEIEYYEKGRGTQVPLPLDLHNEPHSMPHTDTIKNFSRPFDLSQAPLWRVGLIKECNSKYILIADLHNIISDAVSNDIFIRDFTALYCGEVLSNLQISYKDYSEWQNGEQEKETIKKQEDFWKKEFEGEIPVLELPTDYERPMVKSFECKELSFYMDKEKTGALRQLALKEEATLYMVLMAIYNILLSKISGQEDIVVGTPIAGRRHAELKSIIGMFANTLALRNYPSPEKRFSEFLAEVKENCLKAFENQEYRYEDLLEAVVTERDSSRNSLFDVMFVMQNTNVPKLDLPVLLLTPPQYEIEISKFDLTIIFEEVEYKLLFSVEYNTKLFEEETVVRFTEFFKKIVSDILNDDNKDIMIGEIEIISEEERKRLYDFSDMKTEYPSDKTVHEIFERQVEQNPDNIALISKDNQLTYRQVNERSDKLAALLLRDGITPSAPVVLMTERSIDMIVGLLAILKSNGAYLPIDPEYPGKKIQYMIEDSYSQLLLTQNHLRPLLNDTAFEGTVIEIDNEALYTGPGTKPIIERIPGGPVYIHYTSGSTDRPKGVLVEHSSVVNLVLSQLNLLDVDVKDRVLQFSSLCFDASLEQIFITLFSGAALVLIDKNSLTETGKFEEFISRWVITHIDSVPRLLSNLKLKENCCLKRIISRGESCPVPLAKNLRGYCALYNQYGLTEATVTSLRVKFEDVDSILPCLPIGRPVDNTTVYLFDRWMKPVPFGVVGELYIGGEGIARGYLNRPELTSERFISNPLVMEERLFQTGDLCRWLPNGNIEFLGRIENQIKIRGHRIELEVIESALKSYYSIEDAIVVLKDNLYKDLDSETNSFGISLNETDEFIHEIKRRCNSKIKQYPELNSCELSLEIKNDSFISAAPHQQFYWLIQRLFYEEFSDGLAHLDRQAGRFVNGSERKEITGDRRSSKALYDDSRLTICHRQVMQDWKRPLIKKIAEIATESHGDVLEVGFGIGISATYLVEMGIRSYTVIECNNELVKEFEEWRRQYPHVKTRLIHGEWQDVEDQLDTYDAIIFHTHPLDEDEFSEYIVKSITSTEFFFPTAAKCLRKGGVFTYYTNEIDSFIYRHQRLVFKYFDTLTLTVIKPLHPPPDCNYWWTDSMVAVKAVKSKTNFKEKSFVEEMDFYKRTAEFTPEQRKVMDIRLRLKVVNEEPDKVLVAYYITKKDADLNDYNLRQYLMKKLPHYMIPLYFVELDKMPLTVTGKVDRKALPEPESGVKGVKVEKYAAPRNPVEERLVEIWSEVLFGENQSHAPVGINDNFFQLGGHSLKATIMVSKIRSELNVNVPLIEIFKRPFIKELARYIDKVDSECLLTIRDENLVLLRKNPGSPHHLFFIHGGNGEVEGYLEFCKLLTNEFNCWGIRADKIKNYTPQNLRIEEIAGKYLEKMKAIQPKGPYFIVGWCLGGTIAFEMISQLEQRNEEIDFLALIDSPPPRGCLMDNIPTFTLESEKDFIKKYFANEEIENKLENVSNIQDIWPFIVDNLESKHFDVEIIKKVLVEYEAHVDPNYSQLSLGELINYLNMSRSFHNALALYIPLEKIETPVYYFSASQSKSNHIIKEEDWSKYCHRIKYYEITGDHFIIFKLPHVVSIAKIFDDILANLPAASLDTSKEK
jgi:amino acid adenylation domain-containing protein